MKCNVWDTAGAEKYHSLVKGLYHDASAILLVYSIINKTSYEKLVNYWYPQVKQNCPIDIIIGVVANKLDLYMIDEVTEEEAKKFASGINAYYFQTSAKTNSGVEKMFNKIGKEFITLDKFNNSSNKLTVILDNDKEKRKCC